MTAGGRAVAVTALGAAVAVMTAGCPAPAAKTTTLPRTRAFKPDATLQRMHNVRPFFIAGEIIRWELVVQPTFKRRSKLANLKVDAEAILSVGKPGMLEGKRVIIVRSRVKAGGVVAAMGARAVQEFLTHIDTTNSAVTYRLFTSDMMGKRETIETRFVADGYERIRRRRGRVHRNKVTLPATEIAYDVQSILGMLRGWNPKVGTYAFFNALTENTYCRHTVRFTEKLMLRTQMGSSRAIRIDGNVRRLRRDFKVDESDKGRPYTLWLSDDMERRPLRIALQMKRARVLFEIVSYKRP